MKLVNKEILSLAIPSILANITVPLVGMVDVAVAGNLTSSSATLIGGIAVGSMLFDLLYWNFAFLRVGTGGLAAQAFGLSDFKESARILLRAVGIALACALFLIAIQWLFIKGAFLIVDATPAVKELARQYFLIRIWAAPATLSLMAFKGWFIGMQDSISPMIVDLIVNGVNILSSIVLALGIPAFSLGSASFGGVGGIGLNGIAAGTVLAQYCGLLTAAVLLVVKYSRKILPSISREDFRGLFSRGQTRSFFVMNADLFVRSLCFIAIYIGFTTISASYGDLLLAVASIMMKILMIFSYFTDGFAYAAEAMTGRYIGAGNSLMLRRTVAWTFAWSMGIALIFMVLYYYAGGWMLRVMTSDETVVAAAGDYLPWLLLMPLVGCAAFTWDGIYIGATASVKMRNSMLWATLSFFVVYYFAQLFHDWTPEGRLHVLMAAYFAHLLARAVYLSANYRRSVLVI